MAGKDFLSLYGSLGSVLVNIVYKNDVGCFVTSVKAWLMFTEFNFALGGLIISLESYLKSSVIVFIMKIKYMTLTSTRKKSLGFLILVMVLCNQLVFSFVYSDCLSNDQVLDV